jgi:flagellar hook-basal body complex protein FliE
MVDVRFSQAAGAYGNTLKAAEDIIARVKAATGGADETQQVQGGSFMDMVNQSLDTAVASGYKSEDISKKLLMGKADLTDVVTAVSNAETALNTVVAVRDRVINAYQDIIKMPI